MRYLASLQLKGLKNYMLNGKAWGFKDIACKSALEPLLLSNLGFEGAGVCNMLSTSNFADH